MFECNKTKDEVKYPKVIFVKIIFDLIRSDIDHIISSRISQLLRDSRGISLRWSVDLASATVDRWTLRGVPVADGCCERRQLNIYYVDLEKYDPTLAAERRCIWNAENNIFWLLFSLPEICSIRYSELRFRILPISLNYTTLVVSYY